MVQNRNWFKAVSWVAAFLQLSFQLTFSNPAFASAPVPDQSQLIQNQVPSAPITQDQTPQAEEKPVVDSTVDFLQNSSSFTEVQPESENNYVTETYEQAADGIHELQPDMPVAYVAQNLDVSDLRALQQYENEVGLLVAGDSVVVFSTGDQEFIRNLEPVKNLVESPIVKLSAHFHKEGGPSDIDLNETSGLEYVIGVNESGEETVWVHENGQILETLTYEEFVQRVKDLAKNNDADPAEVRSHLNEYISKIDQYRAEVNNEVAGPIKVDVILYANTNGATLPKPPLVRNFEAFADTQNNSFTPVSFEEVHWNYDVSVDNSWAALNLQWAQPVNFTQYGGTFPVELALDAMVGTSAQVPLIVELVDSNNVKVQFLIEDLTTFFQTFNIPLNHPSVPANFTMSSISALNFVFAKAGQFGIPNGADQTGILKVKLFGFPYIAPGTADPIVKLPKVLPGTFASGPAANPDGANVTLNLSSSTFATLNYTGNSANSFGGMVMSYANPINLNTVAPSGIVFSLDGTGSTNVGLEIKDNSGGVWKVDLINLLATGQKYKVALDQIKGINLAQVKEIVFVLNGQGQKVLNIDWGTFEFTPNIPPGDQAKQITPLPLVTPGTFASGATVANTISSKTFMSVAYNGTGAASFGGPVFSYASAINLNTQFPNGIVFQLDSPQLTTLGIEVKDADGAVWRANLTNLLVTGQKYFIDLSQVDGIDKTQVKEIVFVLTGAGAKTLNIDWGNFTFTPTIGLNPNKNPETMDSLPGSPTNTIIKPTGNTSSITDSQSNRGFILNYNTNPGGAVAGGFTYDNFSTAEIETFDLSGETELDFGIRGDIVKVRAEFVDDQDKKASVFLDGIQSGAEKIWSIPTNLLENIDLTKIRMILFYVEGVNLTGGLEVNRIQRPVVIPVPGPIGPSSLFSLSDISLLPEGPTTTAESSINRISSELTELHYDLTGSDIHSRLSIRFDDLETPFFTESSDLSGLDKLVFGISATSAPEVQVEIVDASGAKTVETLIGVTGQEQFYAIYFSALNSPVDLSHIALIRFTVNKGSLTNPIGVLRVRAKGVDTTPPFLAPNLEAVRREIIAQQLQYFQLGVGVDPDTHLPFDQIENGVTRRFTTLTDIGFYLQILGEVVRGSLDNGMTRAQALQELSTVIARLHSMQTADGLGGLLPSVYDMPPTLPVFGPSETFPSIGFGDNANLSQSIAVVIGTLESLDNLSVNEQTLAQNFISSADQFLDNQEDGYNQFYSANVVISTSSGNVVSKLFYASYNTDDHTFSQFNKIDRLANEFRSGVAFVISRYGFSSEGWDNLIAKTKIYQDQFGQNVTNLVPFDGGAFQMFWPLLWSDEQDQSAMTAALKNYLYTAADFSNRNQLPGFVSASAIPEGGYQGKIGIPNASETSEPVLSNVASIYALASAFILNPELVTTWLEAILAQYPSLVSNKGFVDSLRSESDFTNVYNAIDQGSTILGLIGSGGNFMEQYLRNRNIESAYDGLYAGLNLNIQQVNQSPAGPANEFPFRSFAVINNVEQENVLGGINCIHANCVDTDVFGTQIKYTNNTSDFAGHFWRMNESYDARFNQLVLTYSGAIPQNFTVEIKDPNDQLIAAYPMTAQAGSGVKTQVIDLGNDPDLVNARIILLYTDPSQTGPNADFFVHQITFRQFPSQVQPVFAPVVLSQSEITDNLNNLLNFNVLQLQGQGRLAFSSFEFSTPQDFTISDRVFGFKANHNIDYFRLELEDENGVKRSGYITGIDLGVRYYKFLKDFVPAGIDLTKIKRINILIDETALEENVSADDLTVEMSVA